MVLFRPLIKFFVLFFSTVLVCLLATTAIAASGLTDQSKVAINGIGGIRIGMTVAEASRSANVQLVREEGDSNDSCFYVNPKNSPTGIGFMVTEGQIARVDIWENRRITTLSGAKIGDRETRIKALYPGKIRVTPHQYVEGGHYLTFEPSDPADQTYRVVFETDGQRVTRYRSGKLPEVEFVEGCA
jgi:hypothetical protein